MSDDDFPYKSQKVPVMSSVEELEDFLARHGSYYFCLYLAEKDAGDWERSSSRVYMNQVLPRLVYLPINIAKGDLASLRRIYEIVEREERIVAINQTQPHKSNPALRAIFGEDASKNIDAVVKDAEGKLRPYNLNGPAFMDWYAEDIGSLNGAFVVLVGVGGVGEPIARRVIREQPKTLILIDPVDKNALAQELSEHGHVEYCSDLDTSPSGSDMDADLVLVNAAGKEGATNEGATIRLLEAQRDRGHVFLDLRPYLKIEIVERAKQLGWKAYSGHGMNARNDYVLLDKIAKRMGETELPTFTAFTQLVAAAS